MSKKRKMNQGKIPMFIRLPFEIHEILQKLTLIGKTTKTRYISKLIVMDAQRKFYAKDLK